MNGATNQGRCLGMLATVVVLALASGCSTYQQQNQALGYYRHGDLAEAEKAATKSATKHRNGKDHIIWYLELGAIQRAAGKYADSNHTFEIAEERIRQYDEEAKTKLGSETGAFLTTQANLPYRGRAYDKIMLSTYKALNDLQLGDLEKARIELNSAYAFQQDAVEENKRTIEKTQEEVANDKHRAQIKKARENAAVNDRLSASYAEMDEMKVYADYVNPFTVYLDGLYRLAAGVDASDFERARKSLERAGSFAEDNKFVKMDLQSAEDVIAGKSLEPTTYVIFETGEAPERDQIRIDIPIFVGPVTYVGAAFPVLKFHPREIASLQVGAAGTNETTQLLCSIDSVISSDFKNERPAIIAKTIASTVTKAVASAVAKQAAGGSDSTAGLFVGLITLVAQAAVNIADLRTWTTLPKEYQLCRVSTPTDRKIELQAVGGRQKQEVTVQEGMINVLFVKCINTATPLWVSQMKLK